MPHADATIPAMIGAKRSMLEDCLKSFEQLRDGRTLVLLAACAGVALLVLVALTVSMGWLLGGLALSGIWWLDEAIQWTGTAAVSTIAWFAYPLVITAILGLVADQICDAVEQSYYPGLAPAQGLGLLPSIAEAASFLGWALLLNILVLPLYLLPGPNVIVYIALNGWLLGREYFDNVGLRRQSRNQHRQLRRSLRFEIWLAGALIAGLLLIPVANLLAPVLGLALMVHQYHRHTRPPQFNY